MTRKIVAVLLAGFLFSGCGVLRNVHAEADRQDFENEEYFATGPDQLVEILGEPDVWTNEKDGDQLMMTAVWDCVDGEHRRVTWQSRIRDSGQQYWAVIDDVSDECRSD